MNRTDRKRQAKLDENQLAGGIDPETNDPALTAAMARQMLRLMETAKRERNIDPPVKFFHAKVEATLSAGRVPAACGKGCAHCCHTSVSVIAPEALFIAKQLRKSHGRDLVDGVRAAHLRTRDLDLPARTRFPTPCPLLAGNLCSIYQSRPAVCRFAASASATACERVLRLLAPETIPTPARNVRGRVVYEIAVCIALMEAGLPHRHYEFNAALQRALERDDAEAAWLAGEDIFAGIRQDPNDTASTPNAQAMRRYAFA